MLFFLAAGLLAQPLGATPVEEATLDLQPSVYLLQSRVTIRRTTGFRALVHPYRSIVADGGEITTLAENLSLGNLLAYEPEEPRNNELFVWLPGSWQKCDKYTELLETVAVGMLTLCLPYDNRDAIFNLCLMDNSCYGPLRLDAFNGSFSGVPGNNIERRLASALRFLAEHEGGQWGSYLAGDVPAWGRLRMAGHSQGAGAAALVGYVKKVARVVQFSGVCDHSDWTRRLGPPATPPDRFFGLGSAYETSCATFNIQMASWKAEGALVNNQLPLFVHSANVTTRALNHAQTIISGLKPPNCSVMGAPGLLTCDLMGHKSTAENDVWPTGSPYAHGVWQSLCGV